MSYPWKSVFHESKLKFSHLKLKVLETAWTFSTDISSDTSSIETKTSSFEVAWIIFMLLVSLTVSQVPVTLSSHFWVIRENSLSLLFMPNTIPCFCLLQVFPDAAIYVHLQCRLSSLFLLCLHKRAQWSTHLHASRNASRMEILIGNSAVQRKRKTSYVHFNVCVCRSQPSHR